ncbi:MAG: hypothetical protein H6620_05525 [Halobacteriovoraceae bacterium]|nr:hypothetical protein [Halobacteriovoraceae bacterium]
MKNSSFRNKFLFPFTLSVLLASSCSSFGSSDEAAEAPEDGAEMTTTEVEAAPSPCPENKTHYSCEGIEGASKEYFCSKKKGLDAKKVEKLCKKKGKKAKKAKKGKK